ncbi:MAG: SDR family oxidoreductase, partial [Burkholderiales bacterium]
HRRRELWVGLPAVEAILGTRILSGYLDRKLAREAYDGQQSSEPLPPGREDNLYRSVPHGHATHGRFDDRAVNRSLQLWTSIHRVAASGVLSLLILAGYAIVKRR